ncbi:MAG: 1-acyl-sn-glycerol-3-phosphate acyltransferase [Bacteroidaceae bacterium]|nr:1-acyl-sn-glycerol-3-phosphate acyltransferase [Bacteroidaceae bacterium]
MNNFDDIRPYTDEEIPDAMQRIVASTSFPLVASYVFPERTLDDVRKELLTYKTIRDFQMGVMYWANKQIMKRSISDFTYGGLGQLSTDTNYLYVSNHRDIMLDASLMQNVLTDNGFDTCEITFGANLMQGQMVIDVGKSNKMFKVERPGGSIKEFYKASLHLSDYIRTVITEKKQSVWIAQRNGRTKDGIDRTDQGIIKMFGMSRTDDKVKSLAQLNIVPVAVSYEWESCDILKTIELYERRQGPYIKKPGEDLNSILTGITQPKGQVHIEFCEPITEDELKQLGECTSCEFHKNVAELIDRRICTAYRLTPNNYIAHDMLYGTSEYANMYSPEQKATFVTYMKQLEKYELDCDVEALMEIFLGIYSNPIDSKKQFSK